MAGGAAHEEPGLDVTLVYPQLVALKQMERVLESSGDGRLPPGMADQARGVVEAGAASSSNEVARLARRILSRF